jgi:hypothetical protein
VADDTYETVRRFVSHRQGLREEDLDSGGLASLERDRHHVESLSMQPTLDPSAKRRLQLLATFAGVSFIAANIGTIMSAKLVTSHPAILLALSSRNRHLLLTKGAGIGIIAFALIPLLRLAPVAFTYFLLARDYGEQGKSWMEREAGGLPGTVGWAERVFDRVGPASLVLFAGSQLAWLLAGLRKVSTRTFLTFELIGIMVRIAFFWVLGERYESQIKTLLGWIARWTGPLTILLIGTVIYQTRRSSQRMAATQSLKPPTTTEES